MLEDDVLDLSRKMCRFLYMIVVWCVATAFPVSLLERLERAQIDVTVEHVTNVFKSMFILN